MGVVEGGGAGSVQVLGIGTVCEDDDRRDCEDPRDQAEGSQRHQQFDRN